MKPLQGIHSLLTPSPFLSPLEKLPTPQEPLGHHALLDEFTVMAGVGLPSAEVSIEVSE